MNSKDIFRGFAALITIIIFFVFILCLILCLQWRDKVVDNRIQIANNIAQAQAQAQFDDEGIEI